MTLSKKDFTAKNSWPDTENISCTALDLCLAGFEPDTWHHHQKAKPRLFKGLGRGSDEEFIFPSG